MPMITRPVKHPLVRLVQTVDTRSGAVVDQATGGVEQLHQVGHGDPPTSNSWS